jgi:PAS domain S-box-containing protein
MIQLGTPLVGFYDYRLVALSIVIATSTSYAALDLGGRVTAARGWTRSAWLAGGATAMGLGIWSMHFTGMLAFMLPVPVAYHWPTVLVSLLAAMFASALALYVVSRKKMGRAQAIVGSVFVGAGIAGMHYIGMNAMRLPAVCHYSAPFVAVSVLIAGIASLVALVFTCDYREDFKGTTPAKIISAVVMGAAISLTHYTGMWSARFTASAVVPDTFLAVGITSIGITVIIICTLAVHGVAIVTSSVNRRFAMQAQDLQTGERFRQIADSLQEVLVLANGDFSELLYVNRTYQDIWGRTVESFRSEPRSLLDGVHPDERGLVEETLRRLVGGEPIDNFEFRVIQPDGSISFVACRGCPIRDAQRQVYRLVLGAQDITKRKRAEQDLRRVSGQLLRLQDEERRRTARELHDATGQDLVALTTMLGQLSTTLPSVDEKSRALLSDCQGLLDRCIREVRTLSYVLHPRVLDEAGLVDAIRDYANGFTKRSGIRVILELSARLDQLAKDIELALFRVVQESLTNIQRHSGSHEATIRIHGGSNLVLEISDVDHGALGNGPRSEHASTFDGSVGILSMQERVKLVGGRLELESTIHGTTVRVTVPDGGEGPEKTAHSDR